MKKNLLLTPLALLCLIVTSCKKSDTNPSSKDTNSVFEVKVSGFTAATKVRVRVMDMSTAVMALDEYQSGDKTYTITTFKSGQSVRIFYGTNIAKNASADGVGTIKFSFNSQSKLVASGFIGDTQVIQDIKL